MCNLDIGSSFPGIILEETCNQGDDSPNLENNRLCLPYPTCIEVSVGQQNIDDCEIPEGYVGIWGQLYSIEQTTELDLAQNGLTGPIPSEIGELINLTYLNLSLNELSGNIPSDIGSLVKLRSLSMYENQLTGEIPPEIGNLTYLEKLFLQRNQLTGEIPPEIGSLTNIEKLYLNDNQIKLLFYYNNALHEVW